jgi:hypothetical protein
MNNHDQGRGANPTLLKQDVDSGRTGDKIDYPDPVTAPLGTDDEAAGTPITRTQLDMARRIEQDQGKAAVRLDAEARAVGIRRSWLIASSVFALTVLLLVLTYMEIT